MNYDLDGNITSKSDICAPSTTYTDVSTNNQVNAVPNSSSLITPGQGVTYTSFDAPLTIALGSYNMTLQYGPDNNREQTVLTDGLGNTTTRNFATDYENTELNSDPLTEVNYIQCGGDLVAMDVKQGSYDTMNYVYSDNLGSILTVTNSTATYKQSFDAWGNYRNPTDGSYTGIPTLPAWMYRGFTGHEHLAPFQLINMNGRLYDPLINSMLSPDITVQSPTNTQNFNRYSYCLNNPLKYSDPSGYIYAMEGAMMNGLLDANMMCNSLEASYNSALSGQDATGGEIFFSGGGGDAGGCFGGGGSSGPQLGSWAYGMGLVQAELDNDAANADAANANAHADAATAAELGVDPSLVHGQINDQYIYGSKNLLDPYSSSASWGQFWNAVEAAQLDLNGVNGWGIANNVNNAIGFGASSMAFGMNTALETGLGKTMEAIPELATVANTFKGAGIVGTIAAVGIHAGLYAQTGQWGYIGSMGLDITEGTLMNSGNPYAMGAGYGLMFLDVSGNMQWLSNALNSEQALYQSTGYLINPAWASGFGPLLINTK